MLVVVFLKESFGVLEVTGESVQEWGLVAAGGFVVVLVLFLS